MKHSLQKRPPPPPLAQNCSNLKIFYEGLKFRLTSLVGPFSISQNSRPHITAKIEKNCEKNCQKNSTSAVFDIAINYIVEILILACKRARKNLATLQVLRNTPNHPLLHQKIAKNSEIKPFFEIANNFIVGIQFLASRLPRKN